MHARVCVLLECVHVCMRCAHCWLLEFVRLVYLCVCRRCTIATVYISIYIVCRHVYGPVYGHVYRHTRVYACLYTSCVYAYVYRRGCIPVYTHLSTDMCTGVYRRVYRLV